MHQDLSPDSLSSNLNLDVSAPSQESSQDASAPTILHTASFIGLSDSSRGTDSVPNIDTESEVASALSAPGVSRYGDPTWTLEETISTYEQLETLAHSLESMKLVSFDTETFGRGDEPLNARLGLVQLGVPPQRGLGKRAGATKGTVYLVDVVTVQEQLAQRGEHDVNPLAPLKPLFENPEITKVVQNGAFEREQCARYGINLEGISDTMVRGRAQRPDLPGYSLSHLAVEYLGRVIAKDEQTSSWGRRPLRAEQVRYARLDPEITYRIWQRQEEIELLGEIPERTIVAEVMRELRHTLVDQFYQRNTLGEEFRRSAWFSAQATEAVKHALFALEGQGVQILSEELQNVVRGLLQQAEEEAADQSLSQELVDRTCAIIQEEQESLTEPFVGLNSSSEPLGEVPSVIEFLTKVEPRVDELWAKEVPTLQETWQNLCDCLEQTAQWQSSVEDEESLSLSLPSTGVESEFGSARLIRVTRTIADAGKLESLFPDIAASIVSESTTKTALHKAFKEMGYKRSEAEEIIESCTELSVGEQKFSYAPSLEAIYLGELSDLPLAGKQRSAYSVLEAEEARELAQSLETADKVSLKLHRNAEGLVTSLSIGLSGVALTELPVPQVQPLVYALPVNRTFSNEGHELAWSALQRKLSNHPQAILIEEVKESRTALKGFLDIPRKGIVDQGKQIAEILPNIPASSVAVAFTELTRHRLNPENRVGWHEAVRIVEDYSSSMLSQAKEFRAAFVERAPEDQVRAGLAFLFAQEMNRAELSRGSHRALAVTTRRQQRLKELLEVKLAGRLQACEEGEDAISVSEHDGSASLITKRDKQIQIDLLRERYPDVVELLEQNSPLGTLKHFTVGDLERALVDLRHVGLTPVMREAIMKDLVVTTGWYRSRAGVYPSSSAYYSGHSE